MAPEVWENKISPHSDQWSLAVTYAELRISQRLFRARDLIGYMMEIRGGDPDLSSFPEPERMVLQRACPRTTTSAIPVVRTSCGPCEPPMPRPHPNRRRRFRNPRPGPIGS